MLVLYIFLNILLSLKISWLSSVKIKYLGFSKTEFNLSITEGSGCSIPFKIIFFPNIKSVGIIPKLNDVIVLNPICFLIFCFSEKSSLIFESFFKEFYSNFLSFFILW